MRLWHDDIRPAPEGWTWVKTNDQARKHLAGGEITEISMDHDLEFADPSSSHIETGYDLAVWMVENNLVPEKIVIHSWNPVGVKRMASCFNNAGKDVVISRFQAQ